MRPVSVAAVVAGLVVTACGSTESAGDGVPSPSPTASSVAASTTDAPGTGSPYDPSADIRPELMTVTPNEVAPGVAIELMFPAETTRGVAYVLERAAGDTWGATHFLTSSTSGYGGRPTAVSVDSAEGYGWDDIGIGGPGPDRLVVPDDATPGAYRICTANALENFCAEITVSEDAPPNTTSPETVPIETTVPATPVPITAVHEDVGFYPACGNETLTFDGVTWYQLNSYDGYDEEYAAIYQAFADAEREPSPVVGPRGLARVVAPGPGDDIGTLVIWADGVARWISDSRDLDTWMVDDELTYGWEC